LVQKKLKCVSISVIFAMLVVGSAIIPIGSGAFAQQSQNASTSQTNTTTTTAATNALLKPGNLAANSVALEAKMLQLTASNKPQDIATLAYI
jgi:hypothetical protein